VTVLSYAGFIPKVILELKFKGNRLVGRPRRAWFCHLLEDEEDVELARNSKGEDWRLFFHDPPQNCLVLEEEERYAGFNLID
jgi:hypothetical protein